jgi:ribokinase
MVGRMAPGKVVVVGSVNLDLVVRVARLPPAGATVLGESIERSPGGKGANQAVAASRAGAVTELVASIGTDEAGQWLASFLAGEGIGLGGLSRVDRPTGTAVVTVTAGGENAIVIVPGANAALTPDRAAGVVAAGDVVVTQLEVPPDTAAAALTEGRRAGGVGILNFSPARDEAAALLGLADVVVVNEAELAVVADQPLPVTTAMVVTRGAEGAEVRRATSRASVPSPRSRAVDTTGAGDCFLGVMAAWLAGGAELERAVAAGCAAASLQVTRPGAAAAMPRRHEIASRMARSGA